MEVTQALIARESVPSRTFRPAWWHTRFGRSFQLNADAGPPALSLVGTGTEASVQAQLSLGVGCNRRYQLRRKGSGQLKLVSPLASQFRFGKATR